MTLFFCFSFICILILGFTNGAQIGKREIPKPQEDSSLGIINGKNVSITDYPYMASLRIYGQLVGSGVIIDKRWILTTAFNVAWFDKSALEFRVGSNKYNSGGQVLQIEDVIFHTNYTGSWDYDIAVVKVKQIRFNKRVSPINLATQDVKAGWTVQVSGWGETSSSESGSTSEFLTATNVTVLDWQTCKKNYTTDLTPRLMCTYDLKQGPCVGDFGDPIVANKQVYGLFAGGHSCHPPGRYPLLYADVPAFYKWIKGQIHAYSD